MAGGAACRWGQAQHSAAWHSTNQRSSPSAGSSPTSSSCRPSSTQKDRATTHLVLLARKGERGVELRLIQCSHQGGRAGEGGGMIHLQGECMHAATGSQCTMQ